MRTIALSIEKVHHHVNVNVERTCGHERLRTDSLSGGQLDFAIKLGLNLPPEPVVCRFLPSFLSFCCATPRASSTEHTHTHTHTHIHKQGNRQPQRTTRTFGAPHLITCLTDTIMCFNSHNGPSEPCSLGVACIWIDSPPFKQEYIDAFLADPEAPPFLPTPSASSLNLPEYTDRELVENHGLAAGLKLVRSLRKNGITDDRDIMAAFMGAAAIAPELPYDEKRTRLSGFRPNAVNRPDMEPAFFYQEQLDARISPPNAESRQGNTDNHLSQDQPMASIRATCDGTSDVDEAMPDADYQSPHPGFFNEELGIDPVGVRCISPERTVLSNTPRFETPIPNITTTQPSTQVPRLAHGVIKRGVVALLHVEKWSKTFYDRFKEIAEKLDRGVLLLDIFERLAIIFPDHVEWLARGQDVWEKVVKGVKVDTLPDILAFASLSYVISILRVEVGQIQQSQLLSDLHGFRYFITDVKDREVFTFVVDMWGQMGLGVCESVPGMSIGSNLAETPADSLLQDHARNLGLQTQYTFDFAQFSRVGQPNPAALSLRDTPLSLTIHAFFKQPEGFFFALSGRGKTLTRGWETPRAHSFKVAKTLGKEFFGPLKKRMRNLGMAGTKYPKFCALLVVPKRLIVLGYLRTRVEVLEYLLALSMVRQPSFNVIHVP